jgi:hypothetical protein
MRILEEWRFEVAMVAHARDHGDERAVTIALTGMPKEWGHEEVVEVVVVVEAVTHLGQQRGHGCRQQVQDASDCPQ